MSRNKVSPAFLPPPYFFLSPPRRCSCRVAGDELYLCARDRAPASRLASLNGFSRGQISLSPSLFLRRRRRIPTFLSSISPFVPLIRRPPILLLFPLLSAQGGNHAALGRDPRDADCESSSADFSYPPIRLAICFQLLTHKERRGLSMHDGRNACITLHNALTRFKVFGRSHGLGPRRPR